MILLLVGLLAYLTGAASGAFLLATVLVAGTIRRGRALEEAGRDQRS